MDIAMITEPIHKPERNWAGSENKGAAIHWATKIKMRIREIFKGKEFVAIEAKDVVLISCYISPKASLKEFSEVLREMEYNIRLIGSGKHNFMWRI